MLETPMQALIVSAVLAMSAIILGGIGGVIIFHKKLVSKQVVYYIYVPLTVLPAMIVGTYIILPKGSVNFAVRLLVAIGILVISFLPVFPMLPLYERMYIKFAKYSVKEDEESNG